jgi:hypothetical protein
MIFCVILLGSGLGTRARTHALSIDAIYLVRVESVFRILGGARVNTYIENGGEKSNG